MKRSAFFYILWAWISIFQLQEGALLYGTATEKYPLNWNGRIFVLWTGLGEYAWANRIQNAATQLGWSCEIMLNPSGFDRYTHLVASRPTTEIEVIQRIVTFDPDCIINLKGLKIYSTAIPHYVSTTGSVHWEYDAENPNSTLYALSGVLQIAEESHHIEDCFYNMKKPLHMMYWKPSCCSTEYRVVTPSRIFMSGFQWDKKRNSGEYCKLFRMLDQAGWLDVYGLPSHWGCAPNSVRGMTFDENEFRAAMQNSGIALIIHYEEAMTNGDPSPRIFEASAACCVSISDRHPFIVKEFGDSVLYIDENQSAQELFTQIQNHYYWILSHPEEAEAMAREAHRIFSEKFTLEKMLEDFKNFHLTRP